MANEGLLRHASFRGLADAKALAFLIGKPMVLVSFRLFRLESALPLGCLIFFPIQAIGRRFAPCLAARLRPRVFTIRIGDGQT